MSGRIIYFRDVHSSWATVPAGGFSVPEMTARAASAFDKTCNVTFVIGTSGSGGSDQEQVKIQVNPEGQVYVTPPWEAIVRDEHVIGILRRA